MYGQEEIVIETPFICNLCGVPAQVHPEELGREVPSCAACGSTIRLRGLVSLLSREIFGIEMALPDFPVMKGIRGLGMSDPPLLATRLAEKFDYTNSFYHQPPYLDVTKPDALDIGRYDFIVSSEVMEHVPPPVEAAFANLCRMLKPNGVLLLTVPYKPMPPLEEHFPDLHEFTLASPGGRTVLVNRKKDGSIQVFEDLCFHGGGGSTMEMRVYTEDGLKTILTGAGFREAEVASQNVPEFGVIHPEACSLPIVARKNPFQLDRVEIMTAYHTLSERRNVLEHYWKKTNSEYQQHVAFHQTYHERVEGEAAERIAWVQEAEERSQRIAVHAQALETELANLREAKTALDSHIWVRLGKKAGII